MFLPKNLINKPLLSCLLTLELTTVALAYNPPKNPSRPKEPVGSNSTRTNGCSAKAPTSLTALAPTGHIGRTVSQQPTFAWFVPETKPYNMEFTLYEYGESGRGKEIQSIELQSTPGIMTISLSKEKITLTAGNKYLWQIALLCDLNNPAKDLVAETVIEVVKIPADLANTLTKTTDHIKRAQIYADAGFWYDAMAEALKDPNSKAFRLKMLTKLSQLETEAANTAQGQMKEHLQTKASQLQEIVNLEQ
ncbi:MAG: DUF928 domain-containing protein [Scytonema sp. PMC 1069.18]|nr:DUF928 domain-containing protein [Scytonema sp. PMC 1069.18]MEC4882570.1 DUF928 domain-containing protein [Scytonema sp. PMC 1070.18]